MSLLPELLKLWSEAAPNECKREGPYDYRLGNDWPPLVIPPTRLTKLGWAYLEAAVKQAIEARGGRWDIEMADAGLYFAQVFRGDEPAFGAGENAATAILAAHLSAMRALPGELKFTFQGTTSDKVGAAAGGGPGYRVYMRTPAGVIG
jgi:hypothetical protein